MGHQLAGVLEARQIAKLGQERDRTDHVDATHGLHCLDDWCKSPVRHGLAHGLFQPLDPFPDLSYSQQHFLEGDALLAMLKLEAGDPVDVRPPPGFLSPIATPEPPQHPASVLALDSALLYRALP